MKKRFLFNRVDMGCNQFPISMGVEFSSPVLPDTTDPKFIRDNPAAVAAEIAGNYTLIQRMVEQGFFYHFSRLDIKHFYTVPLRIFYEINKTAALFSLYDSDSLLLKPAAAVQ